MLTKEEVIEFKKLVFETYGEEITLEEAMDQGSRLIQLFELLLENRSPLVKGGKVIQND